MTGFTFDAKPVQNEIGQLGSMGTKYETPIYNGVVDPDATWEKFKKEAAPLVKKVQEEYQKQLDAYLKK